MTARIGLDLHVIDGKFQGSRTHAIELFSRVITNSPDSEFFLFLDQPELLPTLSPAFLAPNVKPIRMPAANPIKRLFWQLPALIRRYGVDVIHTQYVLPAPVACARVVTIHDVLFETHPQYFTPLFVARSRLLMRHAARHASHVFTVSEFSRREIVRLYGVPARSVAVIYNGVDVARFESGHADQSVLTARGLSPHGYVLSVGRLEPRKNHQTLVEAMARLGPSAPPLVIVGQRDFHFDGVFETIRSFGLADRVRILEDVSDEELPALYRNATVFAYPSFAEGFGMPPLEAMAAGTPVITSSTTSLPEVAGDAAILVDPQDTQSLTTAIAAVLADSALRQRLSAKGKEQIRKFRWEESAAVVRDRYLQLSEAQRAPADRSA